MTDARATADALPFAARRHDLGAVALLPLDAATAPALAARVVALDPWARLGLAAAAMADRMTRPSPGAHRFAVVDAGRLVGYVAVRHPFMRGPYLETIAILPEAQRRGIARRVIDWMAREVEGLDANLWLCVTEWNATARATYAALGFVEVGPIPDLVAAGQSEIFMRRALAPAPGRTA
jgi:ribosomal protein S18 acetylase RimI-like enzyme